MARTLSLPALADGAPDAVLPALDITAMILTGQLKAGDPVPADEAHAARAGAREHDARAAKLLLKRPGLIQRPPQGRYYLVAPAIHDRPAPTPARVTTPANDSHRRDAESAPHPEEGTSPMPDTAASAADAPPAGPSLPVGGRTPRRPNG